MKFIPGTLYHDYDNIVFLMNVKIYYLGKIQIYICDTQYYDCDLLSYLYHNRRIFQDTKDVVCE